MYYYYVLTPTYTAKFGYIVGSNFENINMSNPPETFTIFNDRNQVVIPICLKTVCNDFNATFYTKLNPFNYVDGTVCRMPDQMFTFSVPQPFPQ